MGTPRIIVALSIAVLLSAISAPSQQWRTCVRVIDGDTIELDQGERIRLIGIDTPELTDTRASVLDFALKAKAYLESLIGKRRVRLEYDQTRTDRYSRTLAYVFREDGTFVNAAAVQQGYAFAYVKYPFKYMDDFVQYEKDARAGHRGLWGAGIENPAANNQTIVPFTAPITKTNVYITRTGQKYHSERCRSLGSSKIPISLDEAIEKGYTPCSNCNPPTAGTETSQFGIAVPPTVDVTVYVTKSGTKYHAASCSSLSRSRIAKSLKDACAAGYAPCSRCNPPACK